MDLHDKKQSKKQNWKPQSKECANMGVTYGHIVGSNVIHLSENTVDNGYCNLFSQ